MDYLDVAEEFASLVVPYEKKTKVKDIMLFGSVAYGKLNPSDLDLLLLHHNPLLESFQDIADSREFSNFKKFCVLSDLFKKEFDLLEIFRGTNVEKLIVDNKFHVKYMDTDFFTDFDYNKNWISRDRKINGYKKKARLPGETFEDAIFRQGLLWNSKTKKYDIPAKSKYKFLKNTRELQNQL